MDTQLVAYLTFTDETKDAMTLYKEIFGGELILQTFGDSGQADTDEVKDRIIHAQLKNEMFTLMASDTHPMYGPVVIMGNSVNLSLIGSDLEKLTEYFTKLAHEGSIEMPLAKQFWGDTFGACTDKFGIHWMVNVNNALE